MGVTTIGRKVISIVLASALLVIIATLATLNNNLKFLNPSTTAEILVFTSLSAVVFLLFVSVLVMLVRNVLKLYADQKSRVMGTRLRTRMLWGAVLVSLLPIAFMTSFSYVLMNRAVDKWFSNPVTEMRDDSNQLALELSRYTTANARAEADSIAAALSTIAPTKEGAKDATIASGRGHTAKETAAIEQVLEQHEITLQGGFCLVYADGNMVAGYHVPRWGEVRPGIESWLPATSGEDETEEGSNAGRRRATGGARADATAANVDVNGTILSSARRTDQPLLHVGNDEYVLGMAGMPQGGLIVVGLPVPAGMTATVKRLHADADTYWTLFRNRRQIRGVYMQLLLMLTTLALFASTWLALHLSKQVTKPVEALADAMDQIAAGDYAHRVQESATEELGELVHSFNRMVADLESSRAQVQASTIQISQANATLEARRSELETMLETIPNGVATLDAERRIVLANRALSEMMDPGGQARFLGMTMEEVFPAEVVEGLDRLMRRSHRMGSASSELEMTGGGGTLHLLATVALLENVIGTQREHRGYVLVLENATELLRAQKQSAWKEVARRVAHEIKNPLTPISLSAEQIHRHIGRLAETLTAHAIESPSPGVIRRCSEVITSSVESMRSLVDQFAALAEFPTARPRPADLNTIVENALAMFAGRLQTIRLVTKMGRDLPLVLADPEALKRALGNLIDNAAEAMQTSLLRELRVTTTLLESGLVELTIADTGTGLTDEMRERLFLPYFSTKQRGTGLGLAIAAKIVQEHQGTIRAERNVPAGAKFIVELRAASNGDVFEGEAGSALSASHHEGGLV
jgi:two-component system, NtrC family, nitrogen regulation sensor histidine kinase NtrY